MMEKFRNLATGKKIIVGILAFMFLPITLVVLSVNLLIKGIKTKKVGKIIAGALCTFIVIGAFASMGDTEDYTPSNEDSIMSDNYENQADTENKENTVETDVVVPEEKVEDNVPTEYKSALKKAKTYSNIMNMSKAGLYDQLTSEYGEKFTVEAAQYAIDNVDADWNANALEKAKTYSNTMGMSKAGLYDQLTSEYGEKFTAEEAQYAIDNIDADWNANALKKAKSYQETMSMSPSAIYDQLVSSYGEKFTAEEAQYAIDNL